MRLQFLGTGAAFTLADDNFQSNAVLEADDGRRLLIDCGSDVRWALKAAGLSRQDIDAVYISHLHGDHIGGMEWFGFTSYFCPGTARPDLFLCDALAEPLWHSALKAGMEALDFGRARLDHYFSVHPLPPDGRFRFGGAALDLVPVLHIRAGDGEMWSYGLSIGTAAGPVLFTSDCLSQPERLMPWYRAARLIFHDCDTGPRPGGAHAHYSELSTLPADIKARMWLYHHKDGPLPDARAAGFLGFVRPRQTFDLGPAA
ncbi:MBL fold metallo-hydrolase [Roseospira navarrensis]|uniref:MBL fold metallo-hydrolase n=1 Tax=Roseospira navarrensis TaxID=140058 RepID=A0A7X1ZD93_9PROT|nr:MBL fold metallo-hydrolase [Roseospira navarrensis]MQX35100.1 MBL fold metallo-hydrolase [Roseospira navarrensis]